MNEKRKPNEALFEEEPQLQLATEKLKFVERVSYNVQQDLIVVTKDKVELCLNRHVKSMEQRLAWVLPFSVGLACLTTLLTSNFRDRFGLKADVWTAIFVIALIVCVVLTIYYLIKWTRARSINEVIQDLRAETIKQAESTSSSN